ncbi:unnamed protein product [Mytilus coruscus]|uniref:Uncharacterized protein n=1 Tax=Mytilus coruscus TaxID=42192 RepID=A0A6J8AD24_MYTCO|nr:unnamed protein product [Mytilus coruscus]
MERNNAVINIYNDEVLEQSNGLFKPHLSKYKTEDQTNDSGTKRGSCNSICNEGENTDEEPSANENAHGRIQDTKFPYDNRNMDATKCQNIVSEYNVDEKRELVIVKNTYDYINDISSQVEGQLDRAIGKHGKRSETKTFVVKNYEANNKIIEESDDVNRSSDLNFDEGEPTKKSFNQITSERDNRESDINSESKTIEKKKKEKLNTLATKTFVLPENEETKYCSLDTTERALADHEHVYQTIKKDSTDNEENKYYSLDKIGRAFEDREHIYNNTKKDLKPETKVKQRLDRTNFDENYKMRNSFDDIEDERRQHGNNDDSYRETGLKSIANHTAIENNIVGCKISDVNIINSYEAVNEENSDGQVYLIEDNL